MGHALKVVAVVQARMSSVRLPGKVLADIDGQAMLEILLARLSKAKQIDQIVVATSTEYLDDPIALLSNQLGIPVFRGDLNDVRSRFLGAATTSNAEGIVRITADCPLVDSRIVDEIVSHLRTGVFDYVSNIDPPTFPDGLDVEGFTIEALERAIKLSISSFEKEHVTPIMRSGSFRTLNISCFEDLSKLRWTVDTIEDLEVIRGVFRHFHPSQEFIWEQVLDLNRKKPEIFRNLV